MFKYIITLKNKIYSKKFDNFLKCHNIRGIYLDDLAVYEIYTNDACAKIIDSFSYVDIVSKDENINIDPQLPPIDIIDPDNPPIDPDDSGYDSTWGPYKIKANYYWDQGYTGQGVKVAIMDAGIYERPEYNLAGGVAFEGDRYPINSHGTQVAGIICIERGNKFTTGVAYGCRLYDINVTKYGDYNFGNMIRGIEWCIDKGIHVLNISLGIKLSNISSDEYILFRDTLQKAKDNGVVVVASIGNENLANGTTFPGRFDSVLGIGATTIDNERWNDSPTKGSNYGKGLNFMAPGKYIMTTLDETKYCTVQGTSFAAPFVTGLVALILSKKFTLEGPTAKVDVDEIVNILKANVLPLPVNTPNQFEYGYGLVQATK